MVSAGLSVVATCFHFSGDIDLTISVTRFTTKVVHLAGSPLIHAMAIIESDQACMEVVVVISNAFRILFISLAESAAAQSSSLGSVGFVLIGATLLLAVSREIWVFWVSFLTVLQ